MAKRGSGWHPFLSALARGAGKILHDGFERPHRIQRKRGAGIVTEIDKRAEKYLLKNIFRKFPESSIITEESGEYKRRDDLVWIIDPLDGTSNYAHGFPWFCVSIGLYEQGQPKAGSIFQPLTGDMYYAEAGRGAFLNGKRIHVSATRKLGDALLGTGFYYHRGNRLREEIEIFRKVQEVALGVRRPGSAALDLAMVASGRYDGFWERGLSSWDVAAGSLLVSEAGGKVSNYAGNPTTIFDREIMASNGGPIHRQVLRLIHS